MTEFLEDSYLTQMVTEPILHNNILDLVIVTQDNLVRNIAVGEHLGSCDHKLVRVDIKTHINDTENKVMVPYFKRANFAGIRRHQTEMSVPNDVNADETWLN